MCDEPSAVDAALLSMTANEKSDINKVFFDDKWKYVSIIRVCKYKFNARTMLLVWEIGQKEKESRNYEEDRIFETNGTEKAKRREIRSLLKLLLNVVLFVFSIISCLHSLPAWG